MRWCDCCAKSWLRQVACTPSLVLPTLLLHVLLCATSLSRMSSSSHAFTHCIFCRQTPGASPTVPYAPLRLQPTSAPQRLRHRPGVCNSGNFIACSGFAPGVKLWTVESEYGTFTQVRCMGNSGRWREEQGRKARMFSFPLAFFCACVCVCLLCVCLCVCVFLFDCLSCLPLPFPPPLDRLPCTTLTVVACFV